jgi:hypothetical protein
MIKKSLDESSRGINKLSRKLFISMIFDIYLTTFKLAGYNSKSFKENIYSKCFGYGLSNSRSLKTYD